MTLQQWSMAENQTTYPGNVPVELSQAYSLWNLTVERDEGGHTHTRQVWYHAEHRGIGRAILRSRMHMYWKWNLPGYPSKPSMGDTSTLKSLTRCQSCQRYQKRSQIYWIAKKAEGWTKNTRRENGIFNPLLFPCTGGAGPPASMDVSQLALRRATKAKKTTAMRQTTSGASGGKSVLYAVPCVV